MTMQGIFGQATKGKIGVLIEDHFDQTEYRKFNQYFPEHGYQVVYISHLWQQPTLTFGSNPDNGTVEEHITVSTEINEVNIDDYKGFICIGAYAMDRLRYQEEVQPGQLNSAPAVVFMRKALANTSIKIGTICHSLWLLCADKSMLTGRKVTCAHNIICDVENASAEVIYEGNGTKELVIDGNLITAKHPEVTDEFMQVFINEIEAKMASGTSQQQSKELIS